MAGVPKTCPMAQKGGYFFWIHKREGFLTEIYQSMELWMVPKFVPKQASVLGIR